MFWKDDLKTEEVLNFFKLEYWWYEGDHEEYLLVTPK